MSLWFLLLFLNPEFCNSLSSLLIEHCEMLFVVLVINITEHPEITPRWMRCRGLCVCPVGIVSLEIELL